MSERHWYVVMCGGSAGFKPVERKDGKGFEHKRQIPEFAAVERIGNEGYEAFCPTTRKLGKAQRHTKKRFPIIVPRWPGYCFARWDERVWLRDRLRWWPEVHDVIRAHEGKPYVVADAVIAMILAIEDAHEKRTTTGDPVEEVKRLLKAGDKVVLRSSVFAGHVGVLTAVERQQAIVLFDMLGVQTRTKVPVAELEPAELEVA